MTEPAHNPDVRLDPMADEKTARYLYTVEGAPLIQIPRGNKAVFEPHRLRIDLHSAAGRPWTPGRMHVSGPAIRKDGTYGKVDKSLDFYASDLDKTVPAWIVLQVRKVLDDLNGGRL